MSNVVRSLKLLHCSGAFPGFGVTFSTIKPLTVYYVNVPCWKLIIYIYIIVMQLLDNTLCHWLIFTIKSNR